MSVENMCNLALTKVGTNNITLFSELTENARRCRIVYEPVKTEVLRAHTWTFATKKALLVLLADAAEIIDYDYVYTYPADCLYINKIYDSSNLDINDYQKLLGNTTAEPTVDIMAIASNTETAYIEYIKNIDDTDLFDDLFTQAFAARLASELVMPLIGDQGMASKFMQEYSFLISQAKKVDKQERHPVRSISSPYLEAR